MTTGNTDAYGPAPQRVPMADTDHEHTRHVLLQDDRGRLTLGRLRPWHRVLARCAASRLDRELAAGASPEHSAHLAARSVQLTSMKARRNLAPATPQPFRRGPSGSPIGWDCPEASGHPTVPGTRRPGAQVAPATAPKCGR